MEGFSGPRTHVRRTCANIGSPMFANITECSTVEREHCEHARTLRTWLRTYVPRTCVREHAKSLIYMSAICVHWHLFRHTSGGGSEIQFGRGEWMERHGGAKQWKLTYHTTYQRTWREHGAIMRRTRNGVEHLMAEAQGPCPIAFLFVRQLHNQNQPRAGISRAWHISVFASWTVSQSEPLTSWKPKCQTKLRCWSLDSFINWATKTLKA